MAALLLPHVGGPGVASAVGILLCGTGIESDTKGFTAQQFSSPLKERSHPNGHSESVRIKFRREFYPSKNILAGNLAVHSILGLHFS